MTDRTDPLPVNFIMITLLQMELITWDEACAMVLAIFSLQAAVKESEKVREQYTKTFGKEIVEILMNAEVKDPRK